MSLRERLYRFRSFWIFPILAAVLLKLTLSAEPQRHGSDLLLFFTIGVLGWTLLEYGLHRFLFHMRVPLRNPHLRDIVNGSHLLHHASPRDATKILVHPLYGLVVSAILYGVVYVISGSLFSAAALMSGIWAGFLYYEAVHYRVHCSLSGTGLVARQRRAHFYHHFTNNKRCFGVTSPLWDYVFRTALRRG
jgi:sterol desaturase/sphingolipid hydroxylase (fatty acid hydroxylase superfamily)